MGKAGSMRVLNQDDVGYIYVLRAGKRIKIGRTINPTLRLKDHWASSPYDLELVAQAKVANHCQLEHTLHAMFAAKQVKPEWFALDNGELGELLRVLEDEGYRLAAAEVEVQVDLAELQAKSLLENTWRDAQVRDLTIQVGELTGRIKVLEEQLAETEEAATFLARELGRLA